MGQLFDHGTGIAIKIKILEKSSDISVLWLCSWYPGRMNATNGDFIERHAKAVSRYARTIVLFVDKDNSLRNGDVQVEKTVDDNLLVYKAYYGASKMGSWWGKLQSLLKFRAVQRKLYRQIVREQGAPNLVQKNIWSSLYSHRTLDRI
jgi:hypothetical protein